VLHGVGHEIDGGHGFFGRAIDEKHGHVVGGKGVGRPAEGVDDFGDFFFGASKGGTAGRDVLQHVANTGAKILAFVNAAGVFHEAADRGHGRHVVFLHDDRQPVGKRGQGNFVWQAAKAGVFWNGRLAFGAGFGRLQGYGRETQTQCKDQQGTGPLKPIVFHEIHPNEKRDCASR
jgi:hypothetical protein